MKSKGIFITFEGTEGCGKSTQISLLRDYFESRNMECVLTREPGGTALAEKIRDLLLDAKSGAKIFPKAELLLFEAARAQHVDELIRPSLEAGKVVISDRFFDSSLAYQGSARGLGEGFVSSANALAVGDCIPDLTILLDLSAAEGLERARRRDADCADRMGSEKLEFYESVRRGFLKIAEDNPGRFAVVDASKSSEDVALEIRAIVKERFDV